MRLAVEEAHQAGHAVDDRGIDHLPLAAAFAFEQRRKDAHRAIHRSAAEIADEVLRRHGQFAALADRVERAGDGDVVEIVAGRLRQRAVLSPAGHSRIDQPRIGLEQFLRAQPQPLHHARTKAFDQHVGMRQRLLDECLAFGALEIDFRAVPGAFDHRVHRLVTGAFDAHDLRAHIGQHHADMRARADALEFDDPEAGQRTVRHFSLLGKFICSRSSWASRGHAWRHGSGSGSC